MAKIEIPKKELIRLYYKEKKSKYKIGDIYGCSFKTVLNRMRDYGMQPLSRSIMQSKYLKRDFCGSEDEKAYILGFRIGDLNVYQTSKYSDVIVVRCHTTREEQINLIRKLFKKYGKVSVGGKNKKGSKYVNCFLNKSFSFLLPKENFVDEWIGRSDNCANNFSAGYIDAEGNIGVYDGRARFKVDSYDKHVIFWMYDWLLKNGIHCPKPSMIGKKGQIYDKKEGYKYNKDLWRVRVSEKQSLRKLFSIIKPLLRHKKRLEHLNICLKNLNDRK